jgi:homoserine dehydrogenase
MKIAILGFGTVGSGAYEAAKSANGIEVKRILDRRALSEHDDMRTTDFNDIVNDSEIDLVAECMGGIHPALDYVLAAMESGKHVVTPNKALVSAHYDELMECAARNHVEFRFTPAAGGGIPWLYNLQRSRRCDTIEEVHGIVNGTCNYILDSMHTNGKDFGEILKEAQDLGYAERDPSADIEGFDTLRKCVISTNLAFGTRVREEDIPVIGISAITSADINFFNRHGYVCRLLMNSEVSGSRISAYVEPTLLTPNHLEANVKANFNLISLTGKNVGTLSFYGQGAGKMPTGTSLVHDMIDINEGIGFSHAANEQAVSSEVDNTLEQHPYYFRLPAGTDFPADRIASEEKSDRSRYIITRSMSVSEAHKMAASYDGAFVAGIKE